MITLKAAAALPQVTPDQQASLRALSPLAPSQRIETMFAASLSAGAAAIHLAAASSHLEPLGDLALGFYWAAFFQIAFAGALLAHPSSRRLATVGVAINVALIAAWAWSRTIGLPTIPSGPEAVGLTDATTVAFQIALVWMLARRLGTLRNSRVIGGSAVPLGPIPGAAFIVGIGLVLLATPIAMADGLTGHGHDGGGHAHPESDRGLAHPAPIESHGHGEGTGH